MNEWARRAINRQRREERERLALPPTDAEEELRPITARHGSITVEERD